MPELKILCLSDTHGAKLPRPHAETDALAWLVAGDVAEKGDISRFQSWARRRPIPVLIVLGNHETGCEQALRSCACDITGSVRRLAENVLAVGVGWCGHDPSNLPGEAELEPVCERARLAARSEGRPGDLLIVLSHYPPSVPDWPPYAEPASRGFYRCLHSLMRELNPVAVIHGHVHELFWTARQTSGGTLLACPGPDAGTLIIGAKRPRAVYVPWLASPGI